MIKASMEELEKDLRAAADLIGIPVAGSAKGRVFQHIQSGAYYSVVAVGIREADLTVEAVYHPLDHSVVRWHRPLVEFVQRFTPVPPPATGA